MCFSGNLLLAADKLLSSIRLNPKIKTTLAVFVAVVAVVAVFVNAVSPVAPAVAADDVVAIICAQPYRFKVLALAAAIG